MSGDGAVPVAQMEDAQLEKRHDRGFQIRRIFVFVMIAIEYMLVFFQRTCPTITAGDMAETYKVEKSELGIFSSIFFYPYGLIQPFAGLLSDIIEPAFIIGGGQLVAAIGAIICGASKSLEVGCVGRFLVGLGCGPTYVPVCRCLLNWFPLKMYATMTGLLLAIGAVGGIIASGPLASLIETMHWSYAFYGVGAIGAVVSICVLIFVRGNPTANGYPPVNEDLAEVGAEIPCKERMNTLVENLKKVVSYGWFWVVVLYCIFSSGPYFDISGLWAAPWLQDVFGESKAQSGTTCISLSIGLIAGSLLIPPLSSALHTRKWALCITCTVAFVVSLLFTTLDPAKISYGARYVMLIFLGATTNSMTSVAYPLVREYYHPAVAGTAVGCANIFTFLSSAVYQTVSSNIIEGYGYQKDETGAVTSKYTPEGYKNGLWLFCTISFALGAVVIAFTKDANFAKKADDGEVEDGPAPAELPGNEDEMEDKDNYGSDLGEL